MIAFRYGVREVAPPAVPAAAASSNSAARAVLLASPYELPKKMRPLAFSEEEMSCIRFGGAADYGGVGAAASPAGAKPAAGKGAKK